MRAVDKIVEHNTPHLRRSYVSQGGAHGFLHTTRMSTNRLQRSHRSTKIPNAKLRPPPARPQRTASSTDADDDAHFRALRDRGTTEGAHTHADFFGVPPLHGITLCFTGLSDEKVRICSQRELTAIALQLGGAVETHLTSAVTHLVARRPGSEKYRWAVRFGMHVVTPEWLYAAHDAWLAGDDTIDTETLDQTHRLGAFTGFYIALSGIDDAAERETLAAAIIAEGGDLAPRLVLDGSLTHLCAASTGRPLKSLNRTHIRRGRVAEDVVCLLYTSPSPRD